jgi:hypothetical protein
VRKQMTLAVAGTAAGAAAFGAMALPASATGTEGSKPAAHFSVQTYAAVGAESHPDDVTRLGKSIYVAYQNGVGSLGEAAPSGVTSSTVQQYGLDGTPGKSWQVVGKVDGMTADSAHDRLLLTSNEDGNSTFSTLNPGAPAALKTFAFAGLTHGGGTDAISIDKGKILVSASHPANATSPAAYTVSLEGSTAKLTPIFTDDAPATAINGPQAGKSVPLALTDPDSNTVVPSASPRFKGDFLLDGQGDMQLVFAHAPGTKEQSLNVLSVPAPLDDTVFATKSKKTLWVTDPTKNVVYSVSGSFTPGQAVSTVSPDTGKTYLATLNLTDGSLTPIKELAAIEPKGLVFINTSDSDARTRDAQHDENGTSGE